MAVNIFSDPTKKVPTGDAQIVRVDMEQQDIGGRKSHLPPRHTSQDLNISHVPSNSSTK